MGDETNIEWTWIFHDDGSITKGATWNPCSGCSKKKIALIDGLYQDVIGLDIELIKKATEIITDPLCENCYMFPNAEQQKVRVFGIYDKMYKEGKITLEERDKRYNNAKYRYGSKFRIHWKDVGIPLAKKKPMMWFVNSMSDLAHEQMPLDFFQAVFETMNKAYWHTFLVLTKRPKKMVEWQNEVNWSKNIWLGTSVGQKTLYYIDQLLETPAYTKFLSCEPLLGPLDLKPYFERLSVTERKRFNVLAGGESPQPNFRPMKLEWVRQLRDDCLEYNVPFFYKQFGGTNKPCSCCGAKGCRKLDGLFHNDRPELIQLTTNEYDHIKNSKQSLLRFS